MTDLDADDPDNLLQHLNPFHPPWVGEAGGQL
jgi:hypothetical protein